MGGVLTVVWSYSFLRERSQRRAICPESWRESMIKPQTEGQNEEQTEIKTKYNVDGK